MSVSYDVMHSTKPTFPPEVPSRPMHPYCQPDKSDPLEELPYFLDDLRVKVQRERREGEEQS